MKQFVMTTRIQRTQVRPLPTAKIRLQYLLFPYLELRVGPLGALDHFEIGGFDLWKDTPDNWQKFLHSTRPARHLAMYVDRAGEVVDTIWVATTRNGLQVDSELWQRLTAVLFYLAWARVAFSTIGRPGAEDFYSEPFALPDGAEEDSPSHVRWSKSGATFWSDIKVYPALEASIQGCHIDLPPAAKSALGPFYDPTPAELFRALEKELSKSQSRLLIGLWFFHQACFRSITRSSYAEDIQNLCSAFEAILDISKKGDSARQVAVSLNRLFRPLSPSAVESAISKKPASERVAVLKNLDEWVKALYNVRNEYSHGKVITTFRFGERSIWQDAFEIFRLAADRVILGGPERKPPHGSRLEKRLMSVAYYDAATAFFSKKNQWLLPKQATTQSIREAIRKAWSLDPELIETISSLKVLRQALFNMGAKIQRTLVTRKGKLHPTYDQVLAGLQEAYSASSAAKGSVNIDEYLKYATPHLNGWVPGMPIEGTRIPLYELVEAYKNLRLIHSKYI
jgi:hypothetical protein